MIVAHLRVANVPSGRPPPTLRHVVLAPWTAQEINDSLTSLSPAVQASSDGEYLEAFSIYESKLIPS